MPVMAKILPCPVPCEMPNILDNEPEYSTRAFTFVYKSLIASHILPLIPNSVNSL